MSVPSRWCLEMDGDMCGGRDDNERDVICEQFIFCREALNVPPPPSLEQNHTVKDYEGLFFP